MGDRKLNLGLIGDLNLERSISQETEKKKNIRGPKRSKSEPNLGSWEMAQKKSEKKEGLTSNWWIFIIICRIERGTRNWDICHSVREICHNRVHRKIGRRNFEKNCEEGSDSEVRNDNKRINLQYCRQITNRLLKVKHPEGDLVGSSSLDAAVRF